MKEHEHFGLIGLKAGDKLRFRGSEDVFRICSGRGVPENGGTLVSYDDNRDEYIYGLRTLTRRLLGVDHGKLPEDLDIWSCWLYEGRTLREMFDTKGE